MFLRLIHVAYRFYWFVFCCVRIYVPFLLLTGVCFQYFAETASDTVAIPGARVCSLSGRTPGRRTGSWGVRAFSLTKWSYTRSFPGWFPQFTVQVTICPIHILWTAVLSDLSFFFFFFFRFKLFTNLLEAQWHLTFFMVISGLSIFSCTNGSFSFQLLWNSCLSLFPHCFIELSFYYTETPPRNYPLPVCGLSFRSSVFLMYRNS